MNFLINQSLTTSICEFIRETGHKAIDLRDRGFQVQEKGFDDYVTNVDRELDVLISQRFQDWFPQDVVISEENRQSVHLWQSAETDRNFWFIDPIDGTDDFIHGREFYSVMVGALANTEPVLGWIYAPKSDLLYWGGTSAQGIYMSIKGSEAQSIPICPPTGACRDRLIVSKKDDLAYGVAIRKAVPNAEFYSLGSFGLKVMEVVLGRASAYIYLNRRVKLWDTVAPLAIAKAAGLICCDLQGRSISFSPDDINAENLIHHQVIVVGWPNFINEYLEAIAKELNFD
ncbi:MAG: inositol monophosphatase family protein [Pseudanabaenaceae cyanobacterium bins.39]|nr:inositol monophosphatase family protein [Pseudanabaenaceae cyanobacterium bins.39]